MKFNSIKSFIQYYRLIEAKRQLHIDLIKFITISILFFLFLGLAESIFYYTSSTRKNLFVFTIFLIVISFSFLVIRFYLNKHTFFNNYDDLTITSKVINRYHLDKKFLNALQLEKKLNKLTSGKDLAKFAIRKVLKDINLIPRNHLYYPIPKKNIKIFGLTTISIILIFVATAEPLSRAYIRLIQPSIDFPIPQPFLLKSLSGNLEIFGGDSTTISISGFGELPDSVNLIWKNSQTSDKISIPKNNDIYKYTFNNVQQNTNYWTEYNSISFFSAWDKISTNIDTIFVIDRPIIQSIQFDIIPPIYTNQKPTQYLGNITDISIIEGSQVRINCNASKILNKGWLLINNEKYNLSVSGNKMTGTFFISNKTNISIHIKDQNEVENTYPPNYRFSIIKDYPPDIILRNPNFEFELDESNIISFNINTTDDYGFSRAWIEFNIKTPDYLTQDTTTYNVLIPNIKTNVKSQQIYYDWDISNYPLAPEDKLYIKIAISDNNTINGPSIAYSHMLTGKYPSIEELYQRLKQDQNEVENYSNEIQLNIDDVKELVEELELEMLKSDDINWEQEQKTNQTINQVEEIFEQIDKIQETMQQLQEKAEQNNLVSDELIEKFAAFQELLDDIITEDMIEAMQKMQEALDEVDPDKLLDALENFEFDMEAFEEQIDRFIDMFELALAEQKIDEVIKRLEKLIEEQNLIINELNENDNSNLKELASRERRQEENFKSALSTMEEASISMQDLSPEASQKLSELVNSELSDFTESSLIEARKELQNQNSNSANNFASSANDGLNEMLSITQNIQSQFQEDTLNELLLKFLGLITNVLFISTEQEKLISEMKGLRARSPKLINIAIQQDKILRQNQQFMIQLIDLSKESFHITPQIASSIGKTKTSMDKIIAKLEQKQISFVKKEMNNILYGLNETAYLLIEAIDDMQMSGSGSGMNQFLEQMEQISQKQQGINQGTMNLPQLSMMAQQQMMEQLQKQQQQLKNQLQELLKQNPNQQTDGLSKTSGEMDEVIDDFRRKQINRQTHERQQRILSRMLDSQKSMTQKDYSDKRKSNSGEEIIYSGPSGLPNDMGEREILLFNAMESALQEGHSIEYQNMMKQYFRNLQQQELHNNE